VTDHTPTRHTPVAPDPGRDPRTLAADPVGVDIHQHIIWRRRLVVAIAAVGVAVIGIVIAIVVLAAGSGTSEKNVAATNPPTTGSTTTEATTTTRATSTTAATTTAAPATSAPPAQGSAGSGSTAYVYPLTPKSQGDYGHSHHDYPASDMFATCGTPFVSPVSGQVQDVVRKDTWSSKTDDPAVRGGLSVSVVGDDGVRYYGSHLQSVESGIEPGVRVTPGQPLGKVGETGNAKGTGCHLHFGISPPTRAGDWEVRRGTIYPWPYLDSWRDGGQKSPVDEVRAYAQKHGLG